MRFDGTCVNLGVEISNDRVVVSPSVLDRVLQFGERSLEIPKAVGRLEIRVGLGEGEQRFERSGEHAFGLTPFCRGLGRHRRRSRRHDGLERLLLMSRITLYGLDHVGDQIMATLELDIDVRPCCIRLFP